ncbi:MAG: hypothetical protein IKS51_03830 [Erysipelotrichaceae bacterium]|nr:hypothetical protein [Erysipelotrichaceae bacterium]
MKRQLIIDDSFIRSHLPEKLRNQPIGFFHGFYLDGLTILHEGERGGKDIIIYQAEDEEDLLYWELEEVCYGLKEKEPFPRKTWRYYRDHAENGQWFYIEHRHYDYNAIEDSRLSGFESFLRLLKYGFPQDRWEKKVEKYTGLMNRWYEIPHWDYDYENLCFIEISDSREHDRDDVIVEEPQPGSIIKVVN